MRPIGPGLYTAVIKYAAPLLVTSMDFTVYDGNWYAFTHPNPSQPQSVPWFR